jgi:hypothetical protein
MRTLIVFVIALVFSLAGYTLCLRRSDTDVWSIFGGVVGLSGAMVAIVMWMRLLTMLMQWIDGDTFTSMWIIERLVK